MTVVVRMEHEHLLAIIDAIRTLKAEALAVDRWGGTSTRIALDIEALGELVERYQQQTAQHPDPWNRKVTT